MDGNKRNKRNKVDDMWKYVIFAYLLFWVMVFALGGSAVMVFKVSPLTQKIVEAFCAWAPTFAFLIMFKKLRPETTLKTFVKNLFSQKIRLDLIFVSGTVVIVGSLLPLIILSYMNEQSFTSYLSLKGHPLPLVVILSLFAGPMGEELGWRGYLRVELDKKYSFLKASIIGGVIWAFWHAVLWFVDAVFMGGSTGWVLVAYIVSNVVVMTSVVIIMNVVLSRSNNLLNAVWVHFCFNIIYSLLTNIDIWYFVLLTVVYAIIGAIFMILHLKNDRNMELYLLNGNTNQH